MLAKWPGTKNLTRDKQASLFYQNVNDEDKKFVALVPV
jgi:hypothetical protein